MGEDLVTVAVMEDVVVEGRACHWPVAKLACLRSQLICRVVRLLLSPKLMHVGRLAVGFLVMCVLTGCAERAEHFAESRGVVSLTLVGQALIEHDPREYLDSPLSSVAPLLSRSDAVFTNLEVAIAGPDCECKPTRDDVYFHGAKPIVLDYLKELGVSLLSLANNHSWDYGTEGVLSTIAEAEARGMAYSGTGADIFAATKPAYLAVGQLTLSLVSMASVNSPDEARATHNRGGVNLLDPGDSAAWDRNLASVQVADSASDVVIVYQHYQTDAEAGWQESWARAVIDAGADIYVSHGEPTLKGVEAYRDGLVLYGLGNFIFHTRTELGRYPSDVWESVIAEVSLDAAGVREVSFFPIALDPGEEGPLFLETRGYPEVVTGQLGQSILHRLIELSAPYATSIELVDGLATLRIRAGG